MNRLPALLVILAGLAASAPMFAQTLTFERHIVRDSMAVNQEAVSFLKPRGWKVSGGVKWYLNHTHQNCIEVQVANPAGLEQVESFAYAHGCWFTNPVVPMPVGQNYLGAVVLRPIDDPREFVRQLTLPAFRQQFNPRIVGYQELPEVAAGLKQSFGFQNVRSGRVRVEYVLNGQEVEEDFYLSIYINAQNLGVNNCVSYDWGPAWSPFSLRAAKGQLNAQTPLLLSIANSARVNPYWFAECNFVREQFQQRMAKGIQMAVELSRYIRENNEAIFKMHSESYWNRQASQDRLAANFSDTIRGVTRYTSPHEKYPVQLPSGYSYAWANPNGQYVLTNSAGYNPNVGGTQNWELLPVVK